MRNPININNCIEAGYVKKTHGVQGGLHLILDESLDKIIEDLDYIFFEIDGLPVPFFIDQISNLGTGYANVQFRNIRNKEQAQTFVGCKLLINKTEIVKESDFVSPTLLTGFTIFDRTLGEIGKITEVNDFGGNIVMTVLYRKQETMIPFNEELLLDFSMENSSLTMDCPQGIFDLSE